eukprot:9183010-Pyramimonas_sp.AAC.1
MKILKAAGAERSLAAAQFGFRSGRGTQDAIFAVRRRIGQALAGRDGRVGMGALDWKKAFDSINANAMITALGRLGLPPKVLGMVQHIYFARRFSVIGPALESAEKEPHSGISQGRPLSPFLLVMLMTVVIRDATQRLGRMGGGRRANPHVDACRLWPPVAQISPRRVDAQSDGHSDTCC